MRKTILLISTCLLSIGALRLLSPAVTTQFMALDPVIAGLAVGVAGLALANHPSRYRLVDFRFIFKALGSALLVATFYGLNSPTFGDLRQTYVPVADLFIMVESGIVMLLLAAEEADEALSPLIYLSLLMTYLHRRLGARLAPPLTTSHRKLV
jgi:hypothetical protein